MFRPVPGKIFVLGRTRAFGLLLQQCFSLKQRKGTVTHNAKLEHALARICGGSDLHPSHFGTQTWSQPMLLSDGIVIL
jgi:hypothetical protein